MVTCWSSIIKNMVTNLPKDCHPPSKIDEIKKLQLNIEFDTSAAQLVICFFNQIDVINIKQDTAY